MAKKKKQKPSLFRFAMLEGSGAIEKFQDEVPSHGPSHRVSPHRVSTKKFLEKFQDPIKHVPTDSFPHHNRLLALAHSYCDQVTEKAQEALKTRETPAACESGCDACCYYTDMDATGLEFEEIVSYVQHHMPGPLRQQLYQQVVETPEHEKQGHRPCPFLDRTRGACSIYPVRPMGCRNLLATKKCQLGVEEDTGFDVILELVQQAWQTMPAAAGTLMVAQEQQRKGRSHLNLHQNFSEVLVKFKHLEPQKLAQLFAPEEES